MRALVAGHLCIDFLPELTHPPGLVEGALYAVGPMSAQPGGCVYTTGRTLAALGVDVRVAATVGTDALSGLLLQLCRDAGFGTDGLHAVAASTSYTIVSQPPGRDRTFWHHQGGNAHFDGAELDLTAIDLLHLGYPSLLDRLCRDDGAPLARLFSRARSLGCATSLDLAVVDTSQPDQAPRWRRFLDRVLPVTDVITPSTDDLASMGYTSSEDSMAAAAERLLAAGAGVVLVSGGPDGLQLATGSAERLAATGRLAPLLLGHAGTRHRQPASPVRRVAGTTGAGDVATAGFLAGLLAGAGPARAAGWAARAAARHIAGDPVEAGTVASANPSTTGDRL